MKFNDIIGHESVKNKLKSLVDNNKIPHAILLYGESGVGKLALARAMAQYIHCSAKQNNDACGICPNCIQHQSLNNADTFFVFPVIKKSSPTLNTSDDYIGKWREFLVNNEYESFERWLKLLENENSQPRIYVNESENIIHKMSMSSYSSKYKIMIMWLPEKMNEDCANKLLKIIEEPYPDSIFILVSDNPKEILPTIFSRTQRIQVNRLSTEDIAKYIQQKYNLDYQDALAIAASADGSMVAAQEALMLDSETKAFFNNFVGLMRMAYLRDIKGLKTWSEDINNFKREKAQRFLQYCCRMLRENYIYNLGNHSLNYLSQDEENFSKKFSPFINERNVEDMYCELNLAETDIQRNANAKIVLFDLALKITKLIRK
ncbi:MAG: DNA polymerase III subunit delta [Muribaculaceae bacterium]|nr:DNA polymerase III subunit delta [Muribaculaceae bacterium]